LVRGKNEDHFGIGSYDRHGPLLEGYIQHPQFDVQYVELDPQQGRYERFLQNSEFDAAELSLSSYLIVIDRGMPVHAVPIFSEAFVQPVANGSARVF
jgi:4,5-dihydroxyphthalate decarboxylase